MLSSTIPDSIDSLVIVQANESSTAVFECEVENIKKTYRVKWIKDGKEIFDEHQQEQEQEELKNTKYLIDPTTYKLTITSIKTNDEGVYDCAIYNDKDEFIIKAKKRFDLQIRGRCLMGSIFDKLVINIHTTKNSHFLTNSYSTQEQRYYQILYCLFVRNFFIHIFAIHKSYYFSL